MHAGVTQYWIVDIDACVIERWRPEDDRPAVCERTLEWAFTDGPAGSLALGTMFGTPGTGRP